MDKPQTDTAFAGSILKLYETLLATKCNVYCAPQ